MKKILYVIAVCFAFTFNASAQKSTATKSIEKEVKVDPVVAAKKDAAELSKLLGLDDTTTDNFYRLFEMKYQALENDLSQERKTELTRVIDAKIRGTLSDDQMSKLEQNQALYKRLIN